MSRASAEMSNPKISIMARASRCSMAINCSAVTACIASQNLRWSSAAVRMRVNRSAAVLFHQSANARLEHGSTNRFSAASAR